MVLVVLAAAVVVIVVVVFFFWGGRLAAAKYETPEKHLKDPLRTPYGIRSPHNALNTSC